jgi:hypothetical protein
MSRELFFALSNMAVYVVIGLSIGTLVQAVILDDQVRLTLASLFASLGIICGVCLAMFEHPADGGSNG